MIVAGVMSVKIKKEKLDNGNMIIKIPVTTQVSVDVLNIVSSGSINGLLVCDYSDTASHREFTYNASSASLLNKNFTRNMSFEDALLLVQGFIDTYTSLVSKGVDEGSLLIKPHYVFVSSLSLQFICIPFANAPNIGIETLFRNLLRFFCRRLRKELMGFFLTLNDCEEALKKIDNYLMNFSRNNNHSDCYPATTFLSSQQESFSGAQAGETTFLPARPAIHGSDNDAETTVLSKTNESVADQECNTTVLSNHENVADDFSEGDTTFLSREVECLANVDEGETTVLSPNRFVPFRATILRAKTGEVAEVKTQVFRIGKSYNDSLEFVITDNINVSRCHASVVFEDASFYFVDNNSTNKSYVEGTMATPYKKIELFNGALFCLADEPFQFFLEER